MARDIGHLLASLVVNWIRGKLKKLNQKSGCMLLSKSRKETHDEIERAFEL